MIPNRKLEKSPHPKKRNRHTQSILPAEVFVSGKGLILSGSEMTLHSGLLSQSNHPDADIAVMVDWM